MTAKTSPDGKGLIYDFSRVKCALHGTKLRECGCHPIWMDLDWSMQRSVVRARRLARLMARKREEQVLKSLDAQS